MSRTICFITRTSIPYKGNITKILLAPTIYIDSRRNWVSKKATAELFFGSEGAVPFSIPEPTDVENVVVLDSRDDPKTNPFYAYNPMDIYVPFGFPVHGICDEHGRFHEIFMDRNTKKLEDFFGISIDDIMDIAGGSFHQRNADIAEGSKYTELLKLLTTTDVNTQVYDFLSGNPFSEDGDEREANEFLSNPYTPWLGNSFIRNTLTEFNFIKLLYINHTWAAEYRALDGFLNSLEKLRIPLMQTMVGNQGPNWEIWREMNQFTEELLKRQLKAFYEE